MRDNKFRKLHQKSSGSYRERLQNSIQAAWEPYEEQICTTQTKNFKNAQAMIDRKLTDRIYHGCYTSYANGERKLFNFEKTKRCICATKNPLKK